MTSNLRVHLPILQSYKFEGDHKHVVYLACGTSPMPMSEGTQFTPEEALRDGAIFIMPHAPPETERYQQLERCACGDGFVFVEVPESAARS